MLISGFVLEPQYQNLTLFLRGICNASALSIMELVVVIIMLDFDNVVMYNKEFKSAAQVRAAMKQFIDYQADINNFRS